MKNYKLERLLNNEVFITSEKGNSMTPILKSGQKHELSPTQWETVDVGDIVYCKVRGNFYTHKVIAKCDIKGCLIGNNHGGINGWTKRVYGKVTKIIKEYL